MQGLVEVDNGGDHERCVVRIFDEHFVSDGEILDLIGGDVSEEVAMEPLEREIDGVVGQRREVFVRDADHQIDPGSGERSQDAGVGVEYARARDSVGLEMADDGGRRWKVVGDASVTDSDRRSLCSETREDSQGSGFRTNR